MPNLGFGEIVVILLVALLVFGPRKLPEVGRTVGKSLREFRRATSNLKAEFEEFDAEPRRTPPRRRRPQAPNGRAPETASEEEPEPRTETGGSAE